MNAPEEKAIVETAQSIHDLLRATNCRSDLAQAALALTLRTLLITCNDDIGDALRDLQRLTGVLLEGVVTGWDDPEAVRAREAATPGALN